MAGSSSANDCDFICRCSRSRACRNYYSVNCLIASTKSIIIYSQMHCSQPAAAAEACHLDYSPLLCYSGEGAAPYSVQWVDCGAEGGR